MVYRSNGGYIFERIDAVSSQKVTARFDWERKSVINSISDLRNAGIEVFASLDSFQLCQELVDTRGNTLLYIAALLGHDDVIRLILQKDDRGLNRRNKVGKTLLYKSCAAGHWACVELLCSSGADGSIVSWYELSYYERLAALLQWRSPSHSNDLRLLQCGQGIRWIDVRSSG
jgi:ankyrin repeat protein